MSKWLADLLNNLFPRVCVLCDAPGYQHLDLCHGCISELPWLNGGCTICAVPLPFDQHTVCGRCLMNIPPYSQCISVFEYRFPIDKLIAEFKFSQQLTVGKVLAYLAADSILQQIGKDALPEILVPVPLHPRRLRERGFNQALEVADVLSQRLAIPVDYQSCKRILNTVSQKSLTAKQRHSNLKKAFLVNDSLQGKSIAIVDDVMTTGATAEALTSCIIKAGATSVQIWTLARTANPIVNSYP